MRTETTSFYSNLGRLLKAHRVARRLSRRQLRDQMGAAGQPNTIYQYETGKSRPSVQWLLRWCDVTGIDLPSLLANVEQAQEGTQLDSDNE